MKKFPQLKLNKDSFLIFVLAGILLFIIVLPTDKGTEEQKNEEDYLEQTIKKQSIMKEISEKSYEEIMEDKLEEAIQYIEGVGLTKIIMTISSSAEIVIEKDLDMDRSGTIEQDELGGTREVEEYKNYEETVYAINKEGTQEPYVVKTILPNIEGIVVICQGGGSKTVAKNITEVIQALFGIEAHKIKVVKMKS